MSAFDEVLSRQRVKLKADWVRDALAAFGSGGDAWQQAPPQQMDAYLFAQLLRSDFAASLAAPALPDPLVDGRLPGPVLLQISRAVNVCRPRHESMLECAPEKRTLKLQLTDGHTTVAGFELEPVPQLSIADFGVKVLLRNVQVQGSMLLLQKENVHVLGGELSSARAEYEAALRVTQAENTKAGKKRRIEEKENPGRVQPRQTMVTQQPQQPQQQVHPAAARRVSQVAQFNVGARAASPVCRGGDEPDIAAGPASVAPAAQQRVSAASSTLPARTASQAAQFNTGAVSASPVRHGRDEPDVAARATSATLVASASVAQSPTLQQRSAPQSADDAQLSLTLSAVLRKWKEQPHAPMIAKGVPAKLVTIKKSADAPQGLVWKGLTQYSCKVVISSPDNETKAEVFLSDRVIEGFVARGTSCVELNRRLEQARHSTAEERAALQQFFKSFPQRFAQMHGRFDIQWPGGTAGVESVQTYGTVVAFAQQAAPSQQPG